MTKAALYLRLSAVVDDSTSIARQEADLRALAEREGWDVVALLVDEGISGRKARAKAAEAVRMLRDGDVDVLAVWKLDRFTRQGWDGLGELSRALAARPGALFVALQDGLRSDQAAFRLIAGVLSEVARSEADNTASRQRSAIDYRKRNGKYAGGSAVPFGYRSQPAPDGVGRVLVPSRFESAVVREVADRLLAEEPLSRVAADLQRRGIATAKSPARRAIVDGADPTGLDRGRWTAATLRNYLGSHTPSGHVRHHGDLIRDVWPALLDADTARRLRARFSPVLRKTPPARRKARLLSGVAFCARCDGKLYVTTSGGKPVYRCSMAWRGAERCGGVTTGADRLEEYVTAQFLAVVGHSPELEEGPADTTELASAELDAALRETTEAMLAEDADVAALTARLRELKAEQSALRSRPTPEPTLRPTGRTLAEAWAANDSPEWRRGVLLTALDHVLLHHSPNKHAPLEDRVTFRWVT
jgi:DNA invertase Pin-like site-specific DNA recombinase